MISIFLAEAAGQTEAASGISKIVNEFGLNWPSFLAQVLNFSIVAFLLWKFAFKPVLATLTERQQKIEAGLKFAEEMKTQLAAAQQQSAEAIRNAQLEANKIIEQARLTSKELSDKAQKEAIEQANGIIQKAQQAIELEHNKMLANARTELARLVVTTTERVLAKRLTDSDRTAYNESAVKELSSL